MKTLKIFNNLKSLTKLYNFFLNGITIVKLKLLILSFAFIYTLFLAFIGYVLYKSYLLTLDSLKEFIYLNMNQDISRLNYYHPTHSYIEHIPTVNQINLFYDRLGIIDYNDYIYNISSNTKILNTILENNSELHAKTTSVVLADIIHQNAQLIGDVGEQLMKRLLRYSLPLFISIVAFSGLYVVEQIQPVTIFKSIILV